MKSCMERLPLRKFDAVVLSIRVVDVSSLTAMSAIQSFPICASIEKAVEWYQEAAEQGHAEA